MRQGPRDITGNVQLYLPERTWGPVRMGGPLVGFGGQVKDDLPPGACGFGIRVKHRAAVASPRPLAAKALPEVPHGALLGVETRP